MLPAVHPALVTVTGLQLTFVFLVIQYRCADLTFAVRCQIAEFTFQLQAAVSHQGRVQGGIVIGSQVEVIGLSVMAA